MKLHNLWSSLALVVALAFPAASLATTVRLQTTLGIIDIQLYDEAAPLTVANFLNYVDSGAFTNSFIHRSVPGFILQGGGYTWNSTTSSVNTIAANPPVANEYSATRSNLRGTIAMAKVSGDPNSATCQWFINLGNNSANLDNQNGGFTVFGQVIDQGMDVVDAIAALPIANAGGPFTELPLATPKSATSAYQRSNLVMLDSVTKNPDMQAPSVPAGLSATASATTIVLSWAAATDNLAVTSYKIYIGGTYLGATTTNTPRINVAGAKPETSYTFTVTACDAANNCSASSAPFSVTTLAAGPTLNLVSGWNLVGNSVNTSFEVASLFGNAANVTTVWKWNSTNSKWAFYTPAQADGGAARAATVGYDTLTRINAAEGFWVHAKQAFTAQLPDGTAVAASALQDLPSGWHLVAVAGNPSPRDFDRALSVLTPPAESIPINFTSLWAWDNATGKWYFYAPYLDSLGGTTLSAYSAGKGYLDFTAAGKNLGAGSGFWVNKP
ncbi:MAG: peptidylprolyl isomerase [Betaproteobacteria bacterium]|nr:peptidylprolyl isomerase [Betaproteobacteria bacterium]